MAVKSFSYLHYIAIKIRQNNKTYYDKIIKHIMTKNIAGVHYIAMKIGQNNKNFL